MSDIMEPRRYHDKVVTLNPKHYRANCIITPMPMCFPVDEGGLGDFLCYVPALQYIAEECPHVYGIVLVHDFVLELAKYFFGQYKTWKTGPISDWDKISGDTACRGAIPGKPPEFNALNSHMMDVGWMQFPNLHDIPQGWNYYPDLTNLEPYVPHGTKLELGKYVVFTTGGTTPTRQVPGTYWNPLINYVISQGLTPVFLGKSFLHKDVTTTFGSGTRYDLGLDLRDKTTLLEAAALMKYAHATIGLDNGLLHLAACAGANVVFGYNIATPETRRPRMRSGRLIEVTLTHAELACIGCQSNQLLSTPQDYRLCMYAKTDADAAANAGLPPPKAPKCIEMLFADDGKIWIEALEKLGDKHD